MLREIHREVKGTAANVSDVSMASKLLREDDEVVYGDSGYLGVEKRDVPSSLPTKNHRKKLRWVLLGSLDRTPEVLDPLQG